MSSQPNDRNKRTPVSWRGKPVSGLYTRTLADGSQVFEAVWKSDGRVRSQRLNTKPPNVTDARVELLALRAGTKDTGTDGPTLGELADAHFDDQQARVNLPAHDRRRRSQRTVDTGRFRFDHFVRPKLGNRPAASLTTLDVAALVRSWGDSIAPATQTGTLNVLSVVLGYGVRQQLLTSNPVRDLHRDDRPGTARTKDPRYLTQAEAESVLRRMSDAYRPTAALMYYLGLRVSEALGLRWSDVDFVAGTLTVTQQRGADGKLVPLKTKAGHRTLTMPAPVVKELRAVKERQDARTAKAREEGRTVVVRMDKAGLIFPAGERNNCRRAVSRAADLAGLNDGDRKPVGCHDLRHSFAYHCLVTLGLPTPQVSKLLGHASVTVTLGSYAGLADDSLADAGEALAQSFGG